MGLPGDVLSFLGALGWIEHLQRLAGHFRAWPGFLSPSKERGLANAVSHLSEKLQGQSPDGP